MAARPVHRPALLPALFALLAVAGAGWLLLRGGPANEEEPSPPTAERDDAATEAPSGTARALQGAPPSAEPPPSPPPVPRPIRPEDLPRGSLVVTALAPDGEAYLPSETRVFLESAARTWGSTPTGIPDPEKKSWRFDKVPAGRVRLRVSGDHVVETTQEAEVEADQVKEVTLHADRAGAVAYKVVLYSGEMPPEVTLALFDFDRKPVRALWQVRMPNLMTSPKADVKVVQGPEGVAFGLRPGRYRLRATSPEEEYDEVDVVVSASQTTTVEIRLRE
jgi:hypothetical protein